MKLIVSETTKIKIEKLGASIQLDKRLYDNVEPLTPINDETNEIMRDILGGELWEKKADNCIIGFSTVGMHVDDVTPKDCVTVLVMLAGKGDLFYFDEVFTPNSYKLRNVMEKHLKQGSVVVFDDRFPHSFSSQVNCAAVVYAVNKKYFQSGG